MEKNINRTKNVLKNICISTVILFLGIMLIATSFKVTEGTESVLYTYTMNNSVNYKVKLLENDYFEQDTLEMDKMYISSLVDKINMDVSYSFAGNKKGNTKYIYQVVAVASVKCEKEEGDKKTEQPVWSKQYTILEPKEMSTNETNFSIKENFDVDFATYNNEVKTLKEQLRLPATADLQVKIVVRSDTEVPGLDNKVVECSILNVKMNLAEDVFTVDKNFKNAEKKDITVSTETKRETNKVSIVIGSILVLIAIMLLLDSIRKTIKFGKRSDYEIALHRILKNYGDIVAEVISPVEIDTLNIIEVKDFDQLLDIEEELRMPILFYETIKGEQGEFMIVCDNVAYRYVIGK